MPEQRSNDDERPAWARRIRSERQARGWSQSEAIRALRAHSAQTLSSDNTLLRNWKRWEAGEAEPDDFYRRLIAKTFGTVTAALFPAVRNDRKDSGLVTATGMDTLELVARLRRSDVSTSTLDALRITGERLCSDYPYMAPEHLCIEGRQWLNRIGHLLDQRLTLEQHGEILSIAGWITLLVGCVEYDMGNKRASEATRQAALSLGEETDHSEIVGWAQEMQAWYALTQGNYRGVIVASEAGQLVAPQHSVSVQLAAQKAKAWARIGDRRQVEIALGQGRTLLESLPHPDNLDNHFVVDPGKFDFYAMDCYRVLGENQLAENYAHEVIEAGTDFDGSEKSPMRIAEARITLGVVAVRRGDVDQAVAYGRQALNGNRQSLPSLLMTSRELATVLQDHHGKNPDAVDYLDQLRAISAA